MQKRLAKFAALCLPLVFAIVFFAPSVSWIRKAIYALLVLPMLPVVLMQIRQLNWPATLLIAAFTGFTTASNLWGAAAATDALYGNINHSIGILLFVASLMTLARFEDYRLKMSAVILASATASALYAMLTFYPAHPYSERLFGWHCYDWPTELGYLYGLGILAGAWVMAHSLHSAIRLLVVVCIVILLAGILLAQARGALMALFVGLSILLLHFKWGRAIALLLVGSCLIFVTLLIFDVVKFRNDTLETRWQLWQFLIHKQNNVWIGVGENVAIHKKIMGELHRHAHSIYISAYYKTGVIGLTLLIAMLSSAFYYAYQQYRQHKAALSLLALSWLTYSTVLCLSDYGSLIGLPSILWYFIWAPIGLALAQWPVKNPQPLGSTVKEIT
ncbi:MAG TPA: O-antigen ligase family protein [Pseudomonadales bacterium]|nr:O-antigen ligase family protein [Pseudomonadales bacterium]